LGVYLYWSKQINLMIDNRMMLHWARFGHSMCITVPNLYRNHNFEVHFLDLGHMMNYRFRILGEWHTSVN